MSSKKPNLEDLDSIKLHNLLVEATIHKKYKLIKQILDFNNINIYYKHNNTSCFELMLKTNDKKLYKLLTKYLNLTIKMLDLALYSNLDFIKYLFSKTVIDHNTCDATGNNALNIAICRAKIDIVKFLLKQNYNPNQLNLKHESSFMLAVIKNNFPMVLTIHKYSTYEIITTFKDNGDRTLLHHAVLVNNLKMVEFLINTLKVNINSTDMQGRTALIYSVIYDYDKITELLLKAPHIDYYIKDNNDKSVLQYAINNKNEKMITLLNSYNIYL